MTYYYFTIFILELIKKNISSFLLPKEGVIEAKIKFIFII